MIASDDPVFSGVLEALDEVGLKHSITLGKGVIIEGGLSDHMKALRVPEFVAATTDDDGMTNRIIAQQGMLPGRRALLAHAVGVLKDGGASLSSQEAFHNPAVDEIYHLVIDGKEVDLILMPS